MISEELLITYGAEVIHLNESELLFEENDPPWYYFQIKTGQVKLVNYNSSNGEFIQSIHEQGESVGEVFLFCKHHRYPATAVIMKDAEILRLRRSRFLELLESDSNLLLEFLKVCAERTYHSYTFLYSHTSADATQRLIKILDHLKKKEDGTEPFTYLVPYTRKELSSMTGLRIETVIRILKKLQQKKIVKIIRRKVCY